MAHNISLYLKRIIPVLKPPYAYIDALLRERPLRSL